MSGTTVTVVTDGSVRTEKNGEPGHLAGWAFVARLPGRTVSIGKMGRSREAPRSTLFERRAIYEALEWLHGELGDRARSSRVVVETDYKNVVDAHRSRWRGTLVRLVSRFEAVELRWVGRGGVREAHLVLSGMTSVLREEPERQLALVHLDQPTASPETSLSAAG
ncbi:MAG: hypothetical protein KGJ23_08505 [Euryarchaeota archaeon]|nr:hypothetical protein [Euryarchaeota archaeon]MDE1836643.1 hypothetical protein [Euryarchaeota archaeon]MDE1879162.1 hypothetical protein [Euryarchaeota archaeon]MDE2044613.1 hypothetical protein [Thermoplasmata archaeon]